MHRFILHNEEILDAGARDLSPGQAGLLNGWGVFSTIRVYDGVLFAWERHVHRMQVDAARLRVPFPADTAALEALLFRLIDVNENPNTVLRVTVVRNRGGLWQGPQSSRDYDVIAYTRDVTPWNPVAKLDLVANGRHAAGPFVGAKYTSWSENLALFERAKERNLDDALLLNERGEVAECTSANIYAVVADPQGTHVWTPPLSSGALPGVTRALLLDEVRVPGIECGERTLLPEDLEAAQEVFISSSTRELIPVSAVEGLRINHAHKVRDALQEAFSRYIAGYVARQAEHRRVATHR